MYTRQKVLINIYCFGTEVGLFEHLFMYFFMNYRHVHFVNGRQENPPLTLA